MVDDNQNFNTNKLIDIVTLLLSLVTVYCQISLGFQLHHNQEKLAAKFDREPTATSLTETIPSSTENSNNGGGSGASIAFAMCLGFGMIMLVGHFTISVIRSLKPSRGTQFIIFFLCIPIAFLLPVVSYVLRFFFKVDPKDDRKAEIEDNVEWNIPVLEHRIEAEGITETTLNSVYFQKYKADAAAIHLFEATRTSHDSPVAKFMSAVLNNAETFPQNYVQSIFTDIPMTLIIFIFGFVGKEHPSNFHLATFALTLISVATKMFPLCCSCRVSAIAWKFSFIMFDFFALVLLFTSFNESNHRTANRPNRTPLYDSWLNMKIICAVLNCVLIFSVLFDSFRKSWKTQTAAENLKDFLYMAMFVILGSAAFFAVQESIKFTLIYAIVARKDVAKIRNNNLFNWSSYPHRPMLHEFLWGKKSQTLKILNIDWQKTYENSRELAVKLYETLANARTETPSRGPRALPPSVTLTNILNDVRVVLPINERTPDSFFARFFMCAAIREIQIPFNFIVRDLYARSAPTTTAEQLRKTLFDEKHSLGPVHQNRIVDISETHPQKHRSFTLFTCLREMFIAQFFSFNTIIAPYWKQPTLFYLFWGILAFTTILNLGFSILFPFLRLIFDDGACWSPLQKFLMVPTTIFFIISLCLLPSAIRYVITTIIGEDFNVQYVQQIAFIVDTYYTIPKELVLNPVVIRDPKIIPFGAVDNHVLPFLTESMIGTRGMLDDDYEKVLSELS